MDNKEQFLEEQLREVIQVLGGYPSTYEQNIHGCSPITCTAVDVARIKVDKMQTEIDKLQGIIDQHDLCHDLHGLVDAESFAHGCVAEQIRVYGYSPHVKMIRELYDTIKLIIGTEMSICWQNVPDTDVESWINRLRELKCQKS